MTPKLDDLRKRLQSKAVLAVKLESAAVAVQLIRFEDGAILPGAEFMLPFGADAVVSDPKKVGAEFAAQLQTLGIRERKCAVCIPPGWALTISSDVPEIATEDLRGYLELRAEREFHVSGADLRMAFCTYDTADGTRRATIAGMPAKRIEAVEQMLAAAGAKAVSVSLGLDRCLPPRENTPAVHFLANGNHVDLVVATGGGVAAMRSLHGSAAGGPGTFDAAAFCREVRITLGQLPEGVRTQVQEARFGGAPDSAQMLWKEIRGPLERMGLATRLQIQNPNASDVAAHAAPAVAAAEQYLRKEPAAFEFLQPEVNRWQVLTQRFDSRRKRTLIAAGVGLVLLPLLAFGIRSHIESSLEEEWNGMRRQVSDLETLQQKIRQYRPWFEPAPQGLAILEGVIGAFPEQGDVWAKGIQISEGSKVTCTGFAKNQAGLMGLLDRLRARPDVTGLQVQQVRGQNPVQFSVTYKWESPNAK